jgi:hypothetical protein
MGSILCRRRLIAVALVVAVAMSMAPRARRVAAQTTEELQRELKAMQAQLEALQQKMKKQEEPINKLSKQQQAATPAAAAAAPSTPAAEAAEEKQEQRIEERVTENVMQKMQPSLAAANKTFPSQFNPAIGLILDNVLSYREIERANFEFRSAEIGISASVDPYARGYAIFNGNNNGIDVEEAAIVTTSLPYNLTLKGGRFFADFGRLSKFHDHDLPFVDRPLVLDEFVGGESQADGLELNYLAPFEQYVTLTAGAYNKIGADNPQVNNNVGRNFNQFTYLAKPATFIPITDSQSVDVGFTWAYTPKINSFNADGMEELRNGKPRTLLDLDLTYRYIPLSQSTYHGLTWGTEVLYNDQTFNDGTNTMPDFTATDAWGMYSYVEAKLTRVFYPGFLFDYTQAIQREQGNSKRYSPFLTIWASEFQRIRLQYSYLDAPQQHESELFAQWTVILGSHVHGFRDR